jgi:dienelactone hydrolase
MRDLIGRTLGHYRIVDKIGEGGMGEVYRAHDERLDRDVAVKVLAERVATNEDRVTRFEREAKAIAKLSHSNILAIHDFGAEDEIVYAVTELLEGESLRQVLSRVGSLPVNRALSVARAVAAGLAAAHAKGIIHRDIKPGNIFVTEDGVVKILDFGLARSESETMIETVAPEEAELGLTTPGVILGTLGYLSPEQARGRPASPASDVFSLGCVLYEMLTGVGPFRRETQTDTLSAVLTEDPPPFDVAEEQIPRELQNIVLKALEKEPDQRYQSGTEFELALADAEDQLAAPSLGGLRAVAVMVGRPRVIAAILILFAAVVTGSIFWLRHQSKVRWAREEAVPKIRRVVEDVSWVSADIFLLARKAEKYLAGEPDFEELLSEISVETTLISQPPGARVWTKHYNEPDQPWELVGETPVEHYRAPLTYLRWKVEKPGFETIVNVRMPGVWDEEGRLLPETIEWTLDEVGSIPKGMVRVLGTEDVPGFLIDRFEVTNRQFKEFVDAGGYAHAEYWKHEFLKDGRVLPFSEGVGQFIDRTGRPGPSGWEAGTYPDGQDDFPVTGVSWYEAAAYADFAGRSLPTIEHWETAAGHYFGATYWFFPGFLIPISNFGREGPVPVGTTGAIGPFGVSDMAGNVREWCWNESPFDRSQRNGFRCAGYPDTEAVPASLFDPYREESVRDLYEETPVSEQIFEVYRQLYSYDAAEIEPVVDARYEGKRDWLREKVSFKAPYGDERIIAQLYLPKNALPPYQTVVYFPGSAAVTSGPTDIFENSVEFKGNLSFIMKSGRAVLYPAYKGTHERRDGIDPGLHVSYEPTHEFSEYQIKVVKDVRRSLDYLETRDDIDANRLAFYGFSWGGEISNIVLAVENRFKAAIVNVGGLIAYGASRPEVDPLNFAPRVTVPVLMLNGRYDLAVPLESSAKPMFHLLGTKEPDKVHRIYDTDHWIEKKELIRESLNWLDTYLGPVEKAAQ